jgi:hypothetical protein
MGVPAAGRPHDGDLSRPGEHSLGDRQSPAGRAGIPPGQHGQYAQRGERRLPVTGGTGQRRVTQQRAAENAPDGVALSAGSAGR